MPKLLLLALGLMLVAAIAAVARAGPELLPQGIFAGALVAALLYIVNEPDKNRL